MQGTVTFKGSYPKLAIGSWIYLHAPNFWGCSGSATFANLSIRSYAPLLSKCRIYALLSSNHLQQLVNIYPKSNHSLPKMVIYALFTSKCRESHLRAFVVKSTRVPGLGQGGGGVKPILAMPRFSRRLLQHSLPNGNLCLFKLWVTLVDNVCSSGFCEKILVEISN